MRTRAPGQPPPGAAGAIIGDSIGYEIGHHYGKRLLGWAQRRFPKHASPEQVAYAEHMFEAHGIWAVFFGRFVALLRIFSGPLSGILGLPYHKFLPANAAGGLLWSLGVTYSIYYIGTAAEGYLKGVAWVGLVIFVLLALGVSVFLRRRVAAAVARFAAENPDRVDAARLA